uniref:O1_Vc6.34 prepropeptide n=1 Tax=Conus victoriae TaxID=319920 RepID=W4VRZ6_CONVC
MKLTCMMIVAVLFLTTWTFATAITSNGLDNRFSKAHHEMKNRRASRLNKSCHLGGEYCGLFEVCCYGDCFIMCW